LIEDYQDLFSSEFTDEETVEPVKPEEILHPPKKTKSSSSVSSTHSSQSSTGSRSSSASSHQSILLEKRPPRAWSLNILNTNELSKSFYSSGNPEKANQQAYCKPRDFKRNSSSYSRSGFEREDFDYMKMVCRKVQ
jgi:hypothetical protein